MKEIEAVQQFQRGMDCAYKDVLVFISSLVDGLLEAMPAEEKHTTALLMTAVSMIKDGIESKRKATKEITLALIARNAALQRGIQ